MWQNQSKSTKKKRESNVTRIQVKRRKKEANWECHNVKKKAFDEKCLLVPVLLAWLALERWRNVRNTRNTRNKLIFNTKTKKMSLCELEGHFFVVDAFSRVPFGGKTILQNRAGKKKSEKRNEMKGKRKSETRRWHNKMKKNEQRKPLVFLFSWKESFSSSFFRPLFRNAY